MHQATFLPYILLLLSVAIVVVAIFKRLSLSPVLGYFAAGAIIGTHGLGLVRPEETSTIAEFGVVFLLFAIGIELTFERLKAMRRYILGMGTLQVLLSAGVMGGLMYLVGKNGQAAIIIGLGLALSSTAIVLQVLAEQRAQATQVGRLSLAILLLQDFAVVPLLVLIPLLARHTDTLFSAVSTAFTKAILVLVGIFILGRLFLRPLFSLIASANPAKINELFVATTLLIALGSAWLTEQWGLSLALGAFVAGLLVAETEFKHQVEESINPFKGLLLGLFFMTVGMSINLELTLQKLPLIFCLTLMLILVKAVTITGLAWSFRVKLGTALHTGLLLAQGGEFSFILFRLAASKRIIDQELEQILLLVVTLSMALTPLLGMIGAKLSALLTKTQKEGDIPSIEQENADLEDHVIIAGFGRVGTMVAHLLEAEDIHYVAIDHMPQHTKEGQLVGAPVYFGDASDEKLLECMGLARAKSVIVTIENEVMVQNTIRAVRRLNRDIPVVVRSKDLTHSSELSKLGATLIVPETYETGLQLGGAVLKSVGINEEEISRLKNRFRAGEYTRMQ